MKTSLFLAYSLSHNHYVCLATDEKAVFGLACKMSLNMINTRSCMVWTEYYLADTGLNDWRVFDGGFKGQNTHVGV